jgi:hypothetical protein
MTYSKKYSATHALLKEEIRGYLKAVKENYIVFEVFKA